MVGVIIAVSRSFGARRGEKKPSARDSWLVENGYVDDRGRPSFAAYTRSWRWTRRRRTYYRRHPRVCFVCDATADVGLHHRSYRNVGEEPDDDLVPLCGRCADLRHWHDVSLVDGHVELRLLRELEGTTGLKRLHDRYVEERRARPQRERRTTWKQDRLAARRQADQDQKRAHIRAKYGPLGKPAPVVVRNADGDVVAIKDQGAFRPMSEKLDEGARALGYAGYADYLQSPHWRELRRMVLERDEHRCRRCGSPKHLQVHHRFYTRLGTEPLGALVTLCGRCHRRIHRGKATR